MIGLYNNKGHLDNNTLWVNHNYEYEQYTDYAHIRYCSDCDYSILLGHNFDSDSMCIECYYQSPTHVHDWSAPDDCGSHDYHAMFCWSCWDIVFEPHSYRPAGYNAVMCSLCGHFWYY